MASTYSDLIWQPIKLKDGIQEAISIYFNTFHKYVFIILLSQQSKLKLSLFQSP